MERLKHRVVGGEMIVGLLHNVHVVFCSKSCMHTCTLVRISFTETSLF